MAAHLVGLLFLTNDFRLMSSMESDETVDSEVLPMNLWPDAPR